ncbi:nucleotidyltransferase domain-containing protein [Acutalibacter sp. JLR.KK004]|mgnify:CR=1 FL=1|uniref:nucleotidyltransferase family protein n=1 Tax=Acutalibacter sp. JLR.KK004 TaxID=3112622 RepID=UPI002FF3260D
MIGKIYSIEEIKRIITPIAGQYGVESVSLFGSYSTGTAKVGSDIDLKIEKGKLRSLFQIASFRLALEDALSLPVDLLTSESSDKEFLKAIRESEVLLYRTAR